MGFDKTTGIQQEANTSNTCRQDVVGISHTGTVKL
jgi:superfamily II DNA/RNA helicase